MGRKNYYGSGRQFLRSCFYRPYVHAYIYISNKWWIGRCLRGYSLYTKNRSEVLTPATPLARKIVTPWHTTKHVSAWYRMRCSRGFKLLYIKKECWRFPGCPWVQYIQYTQVLYCYWIFMILCMWSNGVVLTRRVTSNLALFNQKITYQLDIYIFMYELLQNIEVKRQKSGRSEVKS